MGWDADVVVVGSGPAGGSAAFFLKQARYRVLVVEKARLPRYKVCAGGIPAAALELLPFSCSPVIEHWVERMTFVQGQAQVTHPLPRESLVMVMRDRFDSYLLDQSQAEVVQQQVTGVEQDRDGVNVFLHARTRPLRAGYVIGADGPNSVVGRAVGLRRKRAMGAALEAEVEVSPAVQKSFQGRVWVETGLVNNGYAWIFPKASHLSVGIGTVVKGPCSLRANLEASMARMGISLSRKEVKGYPLPIYTRAEPVHRGRVLLAGDAAGLVDPLTGEGIRHAIESGRLAAKAIANHRVDAYSQTINREIGRDMRWGGWLARAIYSWPRLSFHWLMRHKMIVRDLIRVSNHRMSYQQAIKRAPLYALLAFERARLER